MDLDKAEEIKKLLEAVNGLRRDAMIFIVILAVLALGYFLIKLIVTWKKSERVEESKEKRAELYASGLNAVASTNANLARMCAEMKTALDTLSAKITGKINYADSRRMIEHTFYHDICNATRREIARSLSEDDYEKRAPHVERLVKTNMGRILMEAREHLCLYNLSISAPDYFECISDRPNVERFALCEMIWEKTVSLYTSSLSLKLKIEESQVLVENVITDYVSQLMNAHVPEVDKVD